MKENTVLSAVVGEVPIIAMKAVNKNMIAQGEENRRALLLDNGGGIPA